MKAIVHCVVSLLSVGTNQSQACSGLLGNQRLCYCAFTSQGGFS